jgi:hypothetical protein
LTASAVLARPVFASTFAPEPLSLVGRQNPTISGIQGLLINSSHPTQAIWKGTSVPKAELQNHPKPTVSMGFKYSGISAHRVKALRA